MAFELEDFERSYIKRGGTRGIFNVARSDETLEALRYYAYLNESGSYVIQRITTEGSLTVKVYGYYATKKTADLATDWAACHLNRKE